MLAICCTALNHCATRRRRLQSVDLRARQVYFRVRVKRTNAVQVARCRCPILSVHHINHIYSMLFRRRVYGVYMGYDVYDSLRCAHW